MLQALHWCAAQLHDLHAPAPHAQIGDWEHAQQLMRWLRTLGVSDFAVFPAVGRALCELQRGRVGWLLRLACCASLNVALILLLAVATACRRGWGWLSNSSDVERRASAAGELIGRELAPVYAAACSPDASQPGAPSVQLPPRLLELLTVAGQHLYHDITGGQHPRHQRLSRACRTGWAAGQTGKPPGRPAVLPPVRRASAADQSL